MLTVGLDTISAISQLNISVPVSVQFVLELYIFQQHFRRQQLRLDSRKPIFLCRIRASSLGDDFVIDPQLFLLDGELRRHLW